MLESPGYVQDARLYLVQNGMVLCLKGLIVNTEEGDPVTGKSKLDAGH